MDIKSTFVHEAVVKTPVHVGNQIETKTVQSLNRVTGEVSTKTIKTEKPVIDIVSHVREVQTNTEHLVDLKSGQIIDTSTPSAYHGIN
jgi:hypothetical protein